MQNQVLESYDASFRILGHKEREKVTLYASNSEEAGLEAVDFLYRIGQISDSDLKFVTEIEAKLSVQ